MNFRQWIENNYLLKQKTQKDAARDLELAEDQLSNYVNFKRFPIPETAFRLEGICPGLSIETWLNDYTKIQAKFSAERWLKEYEAAQKLKVVSA